MIAILINVHQNKEQVQRLVNRLKHKDIDIFVHVDKKFDLNELDNAKILNTCYDIKWGDESIIECIMASLEEICNKKYSHYILISGQDYPLVSPDKIVEFLNKNKNKDFLDYVKIGTGKNEWNVSDRYCYYRFNNRILNGISRRLFKKREILKGLPHYGGSLWWILKHESIKYIVSEYRSLNLLNKVKYTVCADEVIFQTILCNSKYMNNIVNNNYRYIDWSDHKKGLNNGNPNVLTKKDFKKIINSNKFFARKFDDSVDKDIYDMIDKYVDGDKE